MNPNANHRTQIGQRLNDIMESWKQNPGRAPNGTGSTGLMSTDSQGYSQMLNEQTEALNIQNELAGKGPVNVRMGRDLGGLNYGLGKNPRWWAQDMQGPYASQTADQMPVSMRSLFQKRGR